VVAGAEHQQAADELGHAADQQLEPDLLAAAKW